MYKITEFVDRFHTLSEEEFLQNFQKPLLLIEKQDKTVSGTGQTVKYVVRREENKNRNKSSLFGRKAGVRPSFLSLVFDFNQTKSKQSFLISVGREENNSIQLKDKSLSKFHAYFEDKTDMWTITDAGSNNGTLLNGELLIPKDNYEVQSNDGICLAYVYLCTFFYPRDFYEYIQWVAQSSLNF